jgi:hypothetical protein
MQPYTALDLLIAMRADLCDATSSHPTAPSCAQSRSLVVRTIASWWRRSLRSGRQEAAAA